MRIVTNKELSTFKILPFDLYSEGNDKILSAGEILTPGKIMMLKKHLKLYTEDASDIQNDNAVSTSNPELLEALTDFSYDTLDTDEFETTVNKEGILKIETQIKLKYYYRKVADLFLQEYYKEGLSKLSILVDIIKSNVLKVMKESGKSSKLRFLGEYELCHPLNVAIMSGLIAQKMDDQNVDLEDVLLAGLLHDIGKFKIHLQEQSALLTTNEIDVVEHTKLGYEIIKNELGLSENIARVALEHHECNDGSGYPMGLSRDYLSELTQIINVANFYDNIAFNRTITHVTNNRDALRMMLEAGAKKFSAQVLYTFIHMFSYDDSENFTDMEI